MKTRGFIIATIVLFALSFLPYGAYAQFTKGTVVQLVNRSSGKAAAANASLVSCADRNSSDYSQLWYVEARSYNAIPIGYKVRLRNLGNGRYLQGNNNPSTPWGTVKSSGSYTAESTYFTTELWEVYSTSHCGVNGIKGSAKTSGSLHLETFSYNSAAFT